MLVKELIASIDTPFEENPAFDDLVRKLLPDYGECYVYFDLNKNGFKQRPVATWLCTDKIVGTFLYYLNDEPICFSHQFTRNGTISFEWASQEVYLKIRDTVRNLIEAYEGFKIETFDPNKEWGQPYYSIRFSSQLMSSVVLYKGVRCAVSSMKRKDGAKKLKIIYEGKVIEVDVSDIYIPIKMKEA